LGRVGNTHEQTNGNLRWFGHDNPSYGIIAPLTNGVAMIVDEAEFDAERWYRSCRMSGSRSGILRRPQFAR
jgi:hypothetical protein